RLTNEPPSNHERWSVARDAEPLLPTNRYSWGRHVRRSGRRTSQILGLRPAILDGRSYALSRGRRDELPGGGRVVTAPGRWHLRGGGGAAHAGDGDGVYWPGRTRKPGLPSEHHPNARRTQRLD